MVDAVLFSSSSQEWATPQDLFDSLDREFHFTLDAAATYQNAKCAEYYNKQSDGLVQPWDGTVWVNPPYGRSVGKWVAKAYHEWKKGSTVVMLLAARTDTRWFHNFIYNKAEIRFLQGRLVFGKGGGRATFPSMVVIWHKEQG